MKNKTKNDQNLKNNEIIEKTIEKPIETAPLIDSNQKIETAAYVPKYDVKPEFQQAVLKAIGDAPFNQIAGIMQAIQVQEIDHNQLQQILGALGNFPYMKIAPILQNMTNFIVQKIED